MKTSILVCLFSALLSVSFSSCRKDGLNSAMAHKIQYKWERISRSSATDYLDGRGVYWTVTPSPPGRYLEFDHDGYFYDNSTKYDYKVDGDKILSLLAAPSRATTPQYTDTMNIKQVDEHLLVLSRRIYYISGAYSQLNESLDSLKK